MIPGDGGSGGSRTPIDASVRPNISRNASTNTAVLRDAGTSSPRPNKGVQAVAADQSSRRRFSSLPITQAANQTTNRTPTPPDEGYNQREASPGPAESDTDGGPSSDEDSSPAQSRIIRRPPRFQQQDATNAYDEDEDDESEPAFQPYRPPQDEAQSSGHDLTSTLRGGLSRGGSKRGGKTSGKEPAYHSHTSDSDTSSPAILSRQVTYRDQKPPGPLSPRRAAEIQGRSPSSKGYSREGSDGTPSMGSSYSDLDGKSPDIFLSVEIEVLMRCRCFCNTVRVGGGIGEPHEQPPRSESFQHQPSFPKSLHSRKQPVRCQNSLRGWIRGLVWTLEVVSFCFGVGADTGRQPASRRRLSGVVTVWVLCEDIGTLCLDCAHLEI
jgi:hypothetical protein